MRVDGQLSPEQRDQLLALLEDLVEDYDEIGFPNVCHCFGIFDEGEAARTSDARCCWVRRAYARLWRWREAHLGSGYGRITERVDP